VVDASERAAKSNGDLEIAGQVQKVAQVHESVWPEQPQQGSGVLGGLSVRLTKQFSEEQLMQLAAQIAFENYRARWNR
jgi:hypothetical protein